MNSGYTIALLSSSAPFCRSPAGLISVKYPSLSVLRFPAKNWYVGVASRSNNIKEGDSSNKEVSIMMDEVLYTGPEKDVEAAITMVRKFWYKKFIIFAFVSTLITLDGILYVIQLLRSSFAESTVAGANQLIAVALGVAIALKLRPPVIRCIKAIAEQEIERMKVTYVNTNQLGTMSDFSEINELLEALIEEDKVNPGRIDVIDLHLVKYLIERHTSMKTNDDIEGKVITPLNEEKTEERGNIEKYGADTKQNKGSTEYDDAWCFRIWY